MWQCPGLVQPVPLVHRSTERASPQSKLLCIDGSVSEEEFLKNGRTTNLGKRHPIILEKKSRWVWSSCAIGSFVQHSWPNSSCCLSLSLSLSPKLCVVLCSPNNTHLMRTMSSFHFPHRELARPWAHTPLGFFCAKLNRRPTVFQFLIGKARLFPLPFWGTSNSSIGCLWTTPGVKWGQESLCLFVNTNTNHTPRPNTDNNN